MMKVDYSVPNQICISSNRPCLTHWNGPKSELPYQTWFFFFSLLPPYHLITKSCSLRLLLSKIYSFLFISISNFIVNRKAEETNFKNGQKPRSLNMEWVTQRSRRWVRSHSITDSGSSDSRHLVSVLLGYPVSVRLFVLHEYLWNIILLLYSH